MDGLYYNKVKKFDAWRQINEMEDVLLEKQRKKLKVFWQVSEGRTGERKFFR